MFVLDSHCDTPSQILRLRDIALDNPYAHVDIPKLRRGGVDGVFFALYVPSSFDADPEAARAYACRMLTGVPEAIDYYADLPAFQRNIASRFAKPIEYRIDMDWELDLSVDGYEAKIPAHGLYTVTRLR
jgi:hypothetical protein